MQIVLDQLVERRKQLEAEVEANHARLHEAMGRLAEINELEFFAKIPAPKSDETYAAQKQREAHNANMKLTELRLEMASLKAEKEAENPGALTPAVDKPVEDAPEAKE